MDSRNRSKRVEHSPIIKNQRPQRHRIEPVKFWDNEKVIYDKKGNAIEKRINDVSKLVGLRRKNNGD